MPEPNDESLALLRGLALFRRLSGEVLEEVARRMVVRTMPRGRLLFRKGEPCRGLYVVLRGQVRVYRANREGKEQVLHLLGPGDPVAEVPLFDGGPYPANARVEADARLLFLPADAFEALVRAEPEIALAVIRELGRRLRRAVRLVEKISLRDVPSRVGLTLLEYGAAAGAGPGEPFTLPRSQAELADELATTRESVARALATLRREGLIRQEARRVTIPDPEALEARAFGM